MPDHISVSDRGRVILVGAGPGDPGLLTLAAKEALESADVVLYDRLPGEGVLALMPAAAEKIDVGKSSGNHPVPQEEINRLILAHALRGKVVVRLKGGDPFLFGRGAEELEAVAARGIPFRVVPGVSSALAAPACAGIPVTHRGLASSLHVFTGHGRGGTEPAIPFREAARLNAADGGTLVFLMGVAALERVCGGLLDAGMPAATPAALVENGTRAEQRRLSATVATLPALAREQAFGPPAVLVVGAVCALAEALDRTSSSPAISFPLRGRRVLAVCSAATGSRLAALLRGRGARVDEFAGVSRVPLALGAAFWESLPGYAWIVLSSEFGVDCLFDGLVSAGLDVRAIARARFAVVGERTREALLRRGIRADFMPGEYCGRALGAGLAERLGRGTQERVLLFRAEAGGEDLPEALRAGGVSFDDVAAYRTVPNAPGRNVLDTLAAGGYDAAAFTSASGVAAFADALPRDCADRGLSLPRAFCIGGVTARAAAARGMRVDISVAATLESMADSMTELLQTAHSAV